MRMKELETLEKIAEKAKLSVVLGEKGLAGKVVNAISPPNPGSGATVVRVALLIAGLAVADGLLGRIVVDTLMRFSSVIATGRRSVVSSTSWHVAVSNAI
jgi:hypothetical protein